MSRINTEKRTFHSVHQKVILGIGSNQPAFIYSIPRRDSIHDDDLEDIDDDDLENLDDIVLQCKTPPLLPNSHVGKKEIHEIRDVTTNVVIGNITFPLSVFIILSFLTCIISVGAIFVHEKYSDIDCIDSYKYISFGYVKWLYIYAWTNIGIIAVMSWLFVISRCSNMKIDYLKLNILRLGYIFQFSWYVIGAILYFIEINKTCSVKDVLYDFGLALFICQTIIFASLLFQDRISR